ncbi:MAG TPA: phosphatase PAP2 family protein [Polyangiaceae bacterium]|nr:phosphatase PAP2 family protein [Polyangiaceae bacterium]
MRPTSARADQAPQEPASESTQKPATEPTQESRVAWDPRWRPVAPWEAAVTGAVLAGSFAVLVWGPEPPDNWRGGTAFDDWLGDGVRLDDPEQADKAATVSDVLYFGSMAYRFVDDVGVAGIGYGDWYLASQMALIDLQSFSVVAAVMFGSQVFVGRQRPEYNESCDDPNDPCTGSSSRFRSFIAGHPATALTAAGLTCTHHARIPLYGGGWGEYTACGLTIAAAGVTGATRVLAGKHYPSDLLMGFGLGAFAGFIMPRLLHYGFSDDGYYDRPKPSAAKASPNHTPMLVRVMPWAESSSLGVSASGIW